MNLSPNEQQESFWGRAELPGRLLQHSNDPNDRARQRGEVVLVNYEGGHEVDQTTERANPNAAVNEQRLYPRHVQWSFELDDTDRAQHAYICDVFEIAAGL